MTNCNTCKANKVCNHDIYGFENCDNYIPENVVEVVMCKDCKHCDPANKHCDNPMGTTLIMNNWISIKEDLPEINQEVLIYRGNHIGNLMNTYTYLGNDQWEDEYGIWTRTEDEGITHWMHLPLPPKE